MSCTIVLHLPFRGFLKLIMRYGLCSLLKAVFFCFFFKFCVIWALVESCLNMAIIPHLLFFVINEFCKRFNDWRISEKVSKVHMNNFSAYLYIMNIHYYINKVYLLSILSLLINPWWSLICIVYRPSLFNKLRDRCG